MRTKYRLLFLLLLPFNVFAQNATSFVRLPGNLGYVIDSAENSKGKLLPNIPSAQFYGGALLQLADSNIVFRVILSHANNSRDIYYTKQSAQQFYNGLREKSAYVPAEFSGDEMALSQLLIDSGTAVKQITFDELYEKDVVKRMALQQAQNDSVQNNQLTHFAVYIGVGIGEFKKSVFGFAAGVRGLFTYKNLSIGVRYSGVVSYEILNVPNEYSRDVSLLAGVNYNYHELKLTALTGISYAMYQFHKYRTPGGIITTYYESDHFTSAGVPVDLQVQFRLSKRVGIGVNTVLLFGKSFYWGEMFTLRFGRL